MSEKDLEGIIEILKSMREFDESTLSIIKSQRDRIERQEARLERLETLLQIGKANHGTV